MPENDNPKINLSSPIIAGSGENATVIEAQTEYKETPRGEVLLEARNLIVGDRNVTYGPPTQNFQNIADMLNVQFSHLFKDDAKFSATDIGIIHIITKLARSIAQPKRDNFVDIAGYAACAWETQEAENAKSEN